MLLINNDNQEKPLSLNETIIGYLQARRIDHRDYSDHLSRGAAPTYPGSSRRSDLVLNQRLHRLLRSHGYKWVRRTGLNSWYVPANSPMKVSPFGRWQFLRKYYLGLPLRRMRESKRKLRDRLWIPFRSRSDAL